MNSASVLRISLLCPVSLIVALSTSNSMAPGILTWSPSTEAFPTDTIFGAGGASAGGGAAGAGGGGAGGAGGGGGSGAFAVSAPISALQLQPLKENASPSAA